MSQDWDDLAEWWIGEIRDDLAYESDVHPMLRELLRSDLGVAMDLGCGEGQGMRLADATVFGCDLSLDLLRQVEPSARVVQAELPGLAWIRDAALDTAYSVYLLDLIAGHEEFFAETARTVRRGGVLVIVINHPVFTAPGSGPFTDEDGHPFWRWGTYFTEGSSTEPAGTGTVNFFHRPMATLLTAAADHGWTLDRMIERGLSATTINRISSYRGQDQIPRLLGVRWIRDDLDR